MKLKIYNNKLSGTISLPASKSLLHRHMIASFLAGNLKYQANSVDTKTTQTCLVDIANNKKVLNCNSSATTLRLLIPILSALSDSEYTFLVNDDLAKRPMDIYAKLYSDNNLTFINSDNKITIKGRLKPNTYEINGNVSSQFVSGLLFALPLLDGDSKLIINEPIESIDYIKLTIDVLIQYGINIAIEDNCFYIKGNQKYQDIPEINIESDYSQSAFFIVAGLFSPYLRILNLNPHSLQGDKRIIDYVKKFKGDIYFNKKNELIIHESKLKAAKVNLKDNPDLAPIIFILASVSKGKSEISGLTRLKYKESDRLSVMIDNLRKMEVNIAKINEDSIIIEGTNSLSGKIELETNNDHRIIMALAIAALKCDSYLILSETEGINKSYPQFWDDFKKLNGEIEC